MGQMRSQLSGDVSVSLRLGPWSWMLKPREKSGKIPGSIFTYQSVVNTSVEGVNEQIFLTS